MNGEWQTWIALGIASLAAAWLVRRFLEKSKGACGGGCDCAGKIITPKREE
ncbi:MAG TPA: FeoB-associated Cys-rich membrane protein [Verrucomicrobiota bacterium]|nr:FeoB-associated Cys-rich membrane protein [Verrucomicrobiota bacterium]